MKLLVDMNLSPTWVAVLKEAGWETVHWSYIGNHCATDSEIMAWAKSNGQVVFTHDLDFGAALALTQAEGPASSKCARRTSRLPLSANWLSTRFGNFSASWSKAH